MQDHDSVLDKWPLPLMAAFFCTASFMAAYEAVKQFIFPGITVTMSHISTVLFSAVVATAITAALLVRYRLGMLIYNVSSDAVLVTDHRNLIVDLNGAFTRITGYTLQHLKGESPAILAQGNHEETFFLNSWEARMSNGARNGEHWSRRRSGERYALSGRVHVVRHPSGRVFRHVLQFSDITERKRAEEDLKKSEADARSLSASLDTRFAELHSMVEANPDFLYVIGANGDLITANSNLKKFCGVPHDDGTARKATDLVYEEDRHDVMRAISEAVKRGYATVEVRFRRYDGVLVPYWCNAVLLTKPNGEMMGITGTGRDVSERKRDEARIVRLATHDTLTGLPNRMLFSDRLQQALATDKRGNARLAVMFVDLDDFKPVNDGFGHDMGDALLREVAKRMQNCVRESDVAARIGGDEFLVLLSSIDEPEHALVVANKIRAAIKRPFENGGVCMEVSASIGVSVYPDHGSEENVLIKNADTAMYYAKENGGNTVRFFGR